MGYERQGIAWSSFPLLRSRRSLKPIVPLWATTATSRTAQWMSPRRISPQRRSCFEMRAASFLRSRKRPGSPFSAKCDSIILAHSQYSASYCELKTLFIAAQRYDGVNSEEAIAYVRALTDLLLVCAPVLWLHAEEVRFPPQPHSRFFQRSVPCDEIGRLVDESTCHKALPLHRIPFPLF